MMLNSELEEELRIARLALDSATCENIIALCRNYLAVLDVYRSELYTLPDKLDLKKQSGRSGDNVDRTRKAVRTAIEHTTCERERTEHLILSFTAVSGYGAVETFNKQKYKGRDDWVLSSGGAGFRNAAPGERMTMQEAVETASVLRREEYLAGTAASANSQTIPHTDIFVLSNEVRKEVDDESL